MAEPAEPRARRAAPAEDAGLLQRMADASGGALDSLLDSPAMDEFHLSLLLERKDLPAQWLERVAARQDWMRSYRIRLRLARHPHTPRRIATRLVRELHLFDVVGVSLLPSAPTEIRRLAEEMVLARLPQLALGEKLTLARRSPARIAAALAAEGNPRVVSLALENPMLTEGQVLKLLAREGLSDRVVAGVARHPKWSCRPTVRLALIHHPLAPLAVVLRLLGELPPGDLRELARSSRLSGNLRGCIHSEIERRARRGKGPPRRG